MMQREKGGGGGGGVFHTRLICIFDAETVTEVASLHHYQLSSEKATRQLATETGWRDFSRHRSILALISIQKGRRLKLMGQGVVGDRG